MDLASTWRRSSDAGHRIPADGGGRQADGGLQRRATRGDLGLRVGRGDVARQRQRLSSSQAEGRVRQVGRPPAELADHRIRRWAATGRRRGSSPAAMGDGDAAALVRLRHVGDHVAKVAAALKPISLGGGEQHQEEVNGRSAESPPNRMRSDRGIRCRGDRPSGPPARRGEEPRHVPLCRRRDVGGRLTPRSAWTSATHGPDPHAMPPTGSRPRLRPAPPSVRRIDPPHLPSITAGRSWVLK